jgi:hypothetical protein
MSEDFTKRPRQTPEDVTRAIAKGVIAGVPIVGGSAAELFELVFSSPLQERRDDWIERIAAVVAELCEKVDSITPEALSKDEAFVTMALQASQIALRTHQEEKLEALLNAVENSALPGSPDDDLKLIFMSMIDSLTPSHLKLLKYLSNPPEFFRASGRPTPSYMMGGIGKAIEDAIPEWRDRRDFYDQLGRDLHGRGLIGTDSFHVTVTGQGMLQSVVSGLGSGLLAFISKPSFNS